MFSRKPSETESAMADAKMLGFFSYGLGITQVLKPGAVNRFIGVPDHNPNHALQRLLGVREIVSGTGILFGNNTSAWMWTRVAGDIMDASIMTATLSGKLGTPKRLIPSIAAVVGLAVVDASVAIRSREH